LSSPAVADGKVYIGSSDGNLYCLNASTGSKIWSYKTGYVVRSSPSVACGTVYVGSFDNKVYAFAASVHDVAITDAASKTVIGRGYNASISVTMANPGDFPETFKVTVSANMTIVSQTQVTLACKISAVVTLKWNTTSFAYGNYTLVASADRVSGELDTDLANNNYTCPVTVHVGVPGDVTGIVPGVFDGRVDIRDITYLVMNFLATTPNLDVNDDGIVNIMDITLAILNFYRQE
jgi:hypothetical protein